MTEKITNLADSTLAADYDAGDPTIEVVDGSVFDVGNRVRLTNAGRTLLLITAIAGDILDVTVEANDDDAPTGTGVFSVLTEGVFDGYRGDADLLTTWAGRAAARKPGLVQRYTDAPYVGVDDGVQILYYGAFPYWRRAMPPSLSSLVWRNQGSAAVVEDNGYTRFDVPNQASVNFRVREMDPPSNHYQITTCLETEVDTTGQRYYGPILYESATGKALVTIWRSVSLESRVYRMNSLTSHNAEVCNISIAQRLDDPRNIVWERCVVDTTNMTFYHSFNGYEWIQIYQETLTAFLTVGPNKIGIFGNIDANQAAVKARFYSFEVEDLS